MCEKLLLDVEQTKLVQKCSWKVSIKFNQQKNKECMYEKVKHTYKT